MIDDFEKYMANEGLLPTWAGSLVIIPMGGSMELNKKYCCYSCPNQKRGYTHNRAKYLGFYSQKKINDVAEIDAVLDLKSINPESWGVKWNNSGQDEKDLMARAGAIIANPDYYAHNDFAQGGGVLLFLLSDLREGVNFEKTSPGGIMGRQYMKFKNINSLDELVAAIKGRTWRGVKDWDGQ
jgi:hypothetical protein